MHIRSASLPADLPDVTTPRPFPEVDSNTVVASSAGCDLTYSEWDRWSNRLARVLLRFWGESGGRVAIAIDSPIERVVAVRAVIKIGGTPVYPDSAETFASDTRLGITTTQRRAELPETIDWLVLDDNTILRHYLAGSDAPLPATGHSVAHGAA
ncbi:AMP-binding protein [Nocardia paucivorans]|uniref:AMP-binding protein n=1 Tax=Nocardia paucivorans TaxID=114259 RepID=UPI0002DD2AA1|nr:AMP-binding protein [Nocardia paucivorans]